MADLKNGRPRLRWAAGAIVACVLLAPSPLHAASDCPTALKGKGSFVVQRGTDSQTEVFFGDGPTIRTALRYQGSTQLETTLYEGLFELSRVDRGVSFESRPKTDLAKFFPLKPKQKIAVDFDVVSGKDSKAKTVRLEYVGAQDYKIGDCTYNVLKFQRNDTWPIVYDNIDYYAPELKFVVAKEYRERNGRTTIIGYTGITSAKP